MKTIMALGLRFLVAALLLALVNASTYAVPGDMPACTIVDGTVNFNPQSILGIDILGEAECVEYDRLTAGTLNVTGGTIQIRLVASYAPVGGEVFNVLNWTTLNGTFQTIDLSQAVLAEGLTWDTSQLHVSGELSINGSVARPDLSWLMLLLLE